MSARRVSGGNWTLDLWHGEGIQRAVGIDRADDLERARQEMRDTGSADIFDAIAESHGIQTGPIGPTEWGMAYGERMPMRTYSNHCNACDRRWTVRIASWTVPQHQEWDHCTECYTGPFAFYSED